MSIKSLSGEENKEIEDLNKMYAQTEIQIQTCAQMRKGGGVRGGVTVVESFVFYIPSVSSPCNTRAGLFKAVLR